MVPLGANEHIGDAKFRTCARVSLKFILVVRSRYLGQSRRSLSTIAIENLRLSRPPSYLGLIARKNRPGFARAARSRTSLHH